MLVTPADVCYYGNKSEQLPPLLYAHDSVEEPWVFPTSFASQTCLGCCYSAGGCGLDLIVFICDVWPIWPSRLCSVGETSADDEWWSVIPTWPLYSHSHFYDYLLCEYSGCEWANHYGIIILGKPCVSTYHTTDSNLDIVFGWVGDRHGDDIVYSLWWRHSSIDQWQ